jgi:hypothetical protein
MMDARKTLLRKLAAITDWIATNSVALEGESWLESRNTIYRFRDGVCFDVASRDPRRTARARTLVGMRLAAWLLRPASVLSSTWEVGACAILWRPGGADSEEEIAMTSASTSFARGRSSSALQALHDQVPPFASQTFRRDRAAPKAPAPRAEMPSSSSYRSR